MDTPRPTGWPAAYTLAQLLADELGWRLVTALAVGDVHLGDLQARLAAPAEAIAERLAQLEQLGLVRSRASDADPATHYYHLEVEQLHTLVQALVGALHPALQLSPLPEPAPVGPPRPRVLFLCTENSARSQLAEGLLHQISRGAVEAFSAGTQPGTVHPLVIELLGEAGQGLRAKHLDTFQGHQFDWVVTVCDRARETCPSFPGAARQAHWSIPDPAAAVEPEAQRRAFTRTVTELAQRIRSLLAFIARDQRAVAGEVAG